MFFTYIHVPDIHVPDHNKKWKIEKHKERNRAFYSISSYLILYEQNCSRCTNPFLILKSNESKSE